MRLIARIGVSTATEGMRKRSLRWYRQRFWLAITALMLTLGEVYAFITGATLVDMAGRLA